MPQQRSLSLLAFLVTALAYLPQGLSAEPVMRVWTTTADQSMRLSEGTVRTAANRKDTAPTIRIELDKSFQPIEGFGFNLTGTSALLLHNMDSAPRTELLQELFGREETSISASYLRISIGASDLDPEVFSYDDLPAGRIDPQLLYFSIARDEVHLIPLLKEILAINPRIKLMGTPWSPPPWMKSNANSKGGELKPDYFDIYANYFVKYIEAYRRHGISIEAVTPQNEPHHGGNNPSMVMTASQQAEFIKDHLGPAFKRAGIGTKIIIWDHNCDEPDYPIEVLNDAAAKTYIHGSAFHLYAGDASALSTVHAAHPDKALYFTEQWLSRNGTFDGDLQWHTKNVIIGTMRNWSRVALEWNLANDPDYKLHTPGGCDACKGAITIDGSSVTRNCTYYVIGHVAKFVPPGSVRIGSNVPQGLQNVAFHTPDKKTVLVVLNESPSPRQINVQQENAVIAVELPAKSVTTLVW